MATVRDKHTVHWFRKGLRLHDNPSLREGLKAASTFRCVFIIDPWFAGSSNVGINKWRFLLQCLEDLDSSLKKLNSRLFVIRGQPADALPKLFKEWGTTSLTFEEDPEPFGRVRDHNIMAMCREIGITVFSSVSHTLYKLDKIIEKNGGRAPLTYHQFQTVIAGMEAPSTAEATITSTSIGNAMTPLSDDHDEKYGVPTLEELGFVTEGLRSPVWVGGESEALTRLERHLERKAWVASFGRPKMTPQSLLASQTGLSPYLRFGCLSTRLFYYQLTDLYKKIKRTRPPLSLHGQLLWREFFYCAATKNPNFDKMVGNPICVQIPWDKNTDALAKWANGQTGFPWIDAIMVQLREEGWIHHLARHAVACFLTRGDLWLSWEEGMKVFEELLLDADWSVNAGTWMWLSCSSFFQQFFHCYCPVRFGRKADPFGDYIRKYIPKLEKFPSQYIHAPWLAPKDVQENAGCIIGRDYPLPMVNHATAARANIQRIKQVYRKLAKYKTTSDDPNKGGVQLSPMIINNINRSNMLALSPSPNTIISNVNHSNYLCNTTSENQNNGFQQNQTNNEQNDIQNNEKYDEDYENCNKTVTDIFEQNQQRNNSGLQMCTIPFKKIVVIGQNYDSIKEEEETKDNKKDENYVDDNNDYNEFDKSEEIDQNFQQQTTQSVNYFNNQKEEYNDITETTENYFSNSSQIKQNAENKFLNHNNADDTQTTQNTYNMSETTDCHEIYDVERKQFYCNDRTSLTLDLDYKMNFMNSEEMQNENEDENGKKTEEEMNAFDQSARQMNANFDYGDNEKSADFQGENIKMFAENEIDYNSAEQSLNQANESFESKMMGNIDLSAFDTSGSVKSHECSLEEEQTRFQQGKTVVMQGCSRPEI